MGYPEGTPPLDDSDEPQPDERKADRINSDTVGYFRIVYKIVSMI